jgi:aromatic ring hydroxylase
MRLNKNAKMPKWQRIYKLAFPYLATVANSTFNWDVSKLIMNVILMRKKDVKINNWIRNYVVNLQATAMIRTVLKKELDIPVVEVSEEGVLVQGADVLFTGKYMLS